MFDSNSANFGNTFRTNEDRNFFIGSARESASAVKEMLPDAITAVKFAAGLVGILAVGCAVLTQGSRE